MKALSAGKLIAANRQQRRRTSPGPFLWLMTGVVLLSALFIASLVLGARPVTTFAAIDALLAYDPDHADHLVIRDYRLPRALLAVLCGCAFGVSGALIQAATKNPLADPGILGVNAGAAFFVTLSVGFFGWNSIESYVWAALAGAILTTLIVHSLCSAGRAGATPVRLVLAGVALSAVLGGIGSSVTLLDPQAFDVLRQWSVGSVSGRDMRVVVTVCPFIVAGLVIALLAARPLNALALGDDFAQALGANVTGVRILVLVAVTLLSGAGTAAAGPIGFIGLMVPHIVRWLIGPDQRWILVLTIVYSAVLLLAADIAGRLILRPGEIEAGIVTAFIGAPVLILLARKSKVSGI